LRARPAPALGAESDAVLAALGYDEDAIIDLKVAGVVL
jgi:crotonobetainyl-CoA:carnitine CoA-transferase CaiB-like acyl-CoA transferase